MRRDQRSIEDLLRQSRPPEVPQMAAALGRVLHRLHAEHGAETDAPTVEWDGARRPRSVRLAFAVAAVIVAAAVWAGVSLRDRGVSAVLEAADASTYRIADGNRVALFVGDRVGAREIVRSDGAAGALLALSDGSRVEMRSMSQLTWDRAPDGLTVRLDEGSVIVSAPSQPNGQVYVRTKDMTASFAGATALVNVADEGSSVAVIQGEARVRDGATDARVRPGEQLSTSPTIVQRPVRDDILWSRNASAHLAILDSFLKGLAKTAGTLAAVASPGQSATPVGQAVSAEFEEESIRECDPDNLPEPPPGGRGGGANSLQMSPGRLNALCVTPATLIRIAYGYAPSNFFNNGGRGRQLRAGGVYSVGVEDGGRVRGGPDWVRTQFYTIEAVAGRPADAETMRGPMLIDLLERRFRLKAHVATEPIPAFTLTVAPGGLKLKEGTCVDPPNAPPATVSVLQRNLDAARRGMTTTRPCGVGSVLNGPNLLSVGAGAGIASMAGWLGVPVVDKTGVPTTTRFNYALEFKPDDRTPVALSYFSDPQMQIAPDPSAVPPAPDLFTVLEQQFGLRLEPTQAPREFIVIDRVERPSPN